MVLREEEQLKLAMDIKDLQSKKFFIPPHPLTSFEIQKYYENEPRFNRVYSRDNLPNKIKDDAYAINLDECSDMELIG